VARKVESSNRLSTASRVAITVAALITTVVLNRLFLLDAHQERDRDPLVATAEVLYVPDTRMLRVLFLGYDQAAADVVWVRTLEYFARHFNGDRQYRWLEHFLDQVIELDPRFQKVYHWAGANVLYGRRFTNANVRLSNRFYELALDNEPNDFEAAYRLGLNYFIELKSDDPEERRLFQEKGLAYLEMASTMPGAPDRLKSLVAGISSRLGKQQLAQQYLIDLFLTTNDPQQKENLRQRIERMREEMGQGVAARAAERFESSWKATLPYVPPALFALLGEPDSERVPDVDWRTLTPLSDEPEADEPPDDESSP
jgi:hypothetical protein